MVKTKIFRKLKENLPKTNFQKISPKYFFKVFVLIFKFSENDPKIHRDFKKKIMSNGFCQRYFPEFHHFVNIPETFETSSVNVCFQF